MWDDVKRRAADKGSEAPETLLARIDENVEFLKAGAEITRLALNEHQKLDDKRFGDMDAKFNIINRSIWVVSGGAAVMVFFINLYFRH